MASIIARPQREHVSRDAYEEKFELFQRVIDILLYNNILKVFLANATIISIGLQQLESIGEMKMRSMEISRR